MTTQNITKYILQWPDNQAYLDAGRPDVWVVKVEPERFSKKIIKTFNFLMAMIIFGWMMVIFWGIEKWKKR